MRVPLTSVRLSQFLMILNCFCLYIRQVFKKSLTVSSIEYDSRVKHNRMTLMEQKWSLWKICLAFQNSLWKAKWIDYVNAHSSSRNSYLLKSFTLISFIPVLTSILKLILVVPKQHNLAVSLSSQHKSPNPLDPSTVPLPRMQWLLFRVFPHVSSVEKRLKEGKPTSCEDWLSYCEELHELNHRYSSIPPRSVINQLLIRK